MLRKAKDVIKGVCPELITAYHSWQLNKIYGSYKRRVTAHGFSFCGNEAMLSGDFEKEETALMMDLMKGVELFVDVGANIGYYTCIARSLNKKVISVEPLSENLAFLYGNLSANHWQDVEVLPLGLSDKPGLATLYGGSTSASLVQRWAGTSELVQRQIPLTTLDLVLKHRLEGRKTLIKVDVEGAEYPLFRGAEQILAAQPAPVWVVEVCLNENHPQGENPHFKAVFELFWKYGYCATTADASREPVTREDVERWVAQRRVDDGNINYIFSKG